MNFTYDNRNRIKTTTDVFNHLVEYGYDANSNRTQLKLDSAVHTNYAYDVANRLTTLTDEASQNFTFGYDIANKLISKTLPNGVNTTYNYDGMNRLTRLKHQSTTATLTDNQFAYNTANQINQIAELTQTKNFSYDSVDRLTSMNNGTANENYAFDSVGNRTSSSRSTTYNYQPFNRVTATQTASFNYDANGNMVSKSEGSNFWHYGWDYENRLTTASTRKQMIRYRYDALGRRVQRYFGRGGGENTKFIYDGLDVVMDDNSGVLTKYQNGLGIDNKLKLTSGGVSKYFLQDHLGSTGGLADSSGNVVSSASYDSFGNSTNNLSTRYQYTGREYDSYIGLTYYRARWYDANLGRFISEDPTGFAGGDVNLFGYVKNKPVNRRDPTGLDDADIAFRETEQYKELERQGKEFWKSVRDSPKLPKKPECGPAANPIVEWLVPDSVGGPFGPFGNKYKITPACESHDSCYDTCGASKEQCDAQLRADATNICLQGGGSAKACAFYGNGYYQGVYWGGDGAYKSAQEGKGCIACSLPLSPPPRDPCSNFGDWRCK